MNLRRKSIKRRTEAGAAMLIAIFALLLISVIAIALIVSSGTESALAKNYRTSTSAYYAGVAGLEEARGRLLWRNANYVNNVIPGFISASGTPNMTLSQVLYILNPAGDEVVNPTDLSSSNPYADNEYLNEFGIPVTSATVQTINSVSGAGGVPGPQFKWVRVTPATEKSLGLDVNADGFLDPISLLYYDPTHISAANGLPKPGLVPNPPLPPAPQLQALEITALAVIPPNTQKLLQYVVGPGLLTLNFPSALTLDGNNVAYTGPSSNSFIVTGNDNTVNRTCASAPVPSVVAIGYTNSADNSRTSIVAGASLQPGNYVGAVPLPPPPPALPFPPTPSVGSVTAGAVSLAPSMLKPSSLDSLVKTITQNADIMLAPQPPATTVTGAQLPASMNPSNPMNIVINGDLDLTSWHNQGYGLLLVTGNLIYDPDASWYGIVLVIGKGAVIGSHAGSGRIQGAMFVAQTRDPVTGSLLPDPNLGAAFVSFNPAMGGAGIYYDSCWIDAALRPLTYQVLSFREIPLN
jgi:hypothetical protein